MAGSDSTDASLSRRGQLGPKNIARLLTGLR